MCHEEQEDDDVEHDNVKTAPQAPGHGLQDNPPAGIKQSVLVIKYNISTSPDDNIVGVQNCSVGHKYTEKPTGILAEYRHLSECLIGIIHAALSGHWGGGRRPLINGQSWFGSSKIE